MYLIPRETSSVGLFEPWSMLQRMHDDLSRRFGEDTSSVATSRWAPAVDIKEEDRQFLITADVPGVDPKDIEVTMENGMLTVRGERKLETDRREDGYRRVERVHGAFYRRFSLPDYADAEKITAKVKNGVLEVVVPKTEKVQPRRIEVKA